MKLKYVWDSVWFVWFADEESDTDLEETSIVCAWCLQPGTKQFTLKTKDGVKVVKPLLETAQLNTGISVFLNISAVS